MGEAGYTPYWVASSLQGKKDIFFPPKIIDES